MRSFAAEHSFVITRQLGCWGCYCVCLLLHPQPRGDFNIIQYTWGAAHLINQLSTSRCRAGLGSVKMITSNRLADIAKPQHWHHAVIKWWDYRTVVSLKLYHHSSKRLYSIFILSTQLLRHFHLKLESITIIMIHQKALLKGLVQVLGKHLKHALEIWHPTNQPMNYWRCAAGDPTHSCCPLLSPVVGNL